MPRGTKKKLSLELLKFVNCIIFAFLNVFLIYEMRDDEKLKFSFRRWTVIFILSIVLIIVANCIVPLNFKMPVTILLLFAICQLMYKINFIKKIFLCVLALSLFWLTDTIALSVFIVALKINMMDIIEVPNYYIFYNLINILLIILTIVLLKTKRFIFNINKSISRRTKYLLLAIILLQFINISVHFFMSYYILDVPRVHFIIIISYVCIIVSIGILLYSTNDIIDKENIIRVSNEYNENLKVYNNVLQNSIENQREIAHEHGNQLAVLSGYIASAELEKAKIYLSRILGNCNSENEFLSHIQESGLKALLVFKIAMIERKNIDFELVVDEDIHNTIIPSEDLCQIMGIFLDNAIDAAVQSEEPYITMTIIKGDKELDIIIMNSIKDEHIDIEKIYQKGYSSKGEGRGFGLHIVDEIIKKYEQLKLNTRVEDGLFIQELHVTNKSASSIMI
jgi:two-component system sensor histidine kinase AgrC